MRNIPRVHLDSRFLFGLSATVATAVMVGMAPLIDSEWPPKPDATRGGNEPNGTGNIPSHIQMGKISISIPEEFARWFNHTHISGGNPGWDEWPVDFAIGDIEGTKYDGDLNIAMYMADEVLLGARLEIDWAAKTGTLVPLWGWKLPTESPHENAEVCCQPIQSWCPNTSERASFRQNCLIWDFDNDGKNEVALVGHAQYPNSSAWGSAIYVVQEDPSPPPQSTWDFSVPPPKILAMSEVHAEESETSKIQDRLSICRLRDTPYRQDIVSTSHKGTTLSVWRMPNNPSSNQLVEVAWTDWNSEQTHEFNHGDIDGDGYDEFVWDGVLDFVDSVNGVATPTNPTNPEKGIWRWRTGIGVGNHDHMDHMLLLDFDPNNPGLEINSTPENSYTDHLGAPRPATDTLWNTDGTVLRANDDCPFVHGQGMHVGNWTKTRDGLESIYVPKCFNPGTVNGGEAWYVGSYAVDAQQNELVVDGAYWKDVKIAGDYPFIRSSGPTFRMWQIDWDGDHSQDEIFNYLWKTLYVWRMGEKGDWGVTPPPGMPTEAELQSPFQDTNYLPGVDLWWDYYQGYDGGNITWEHGGPGSYTHYYEKLGETWPESGWWFPLAWDVGGDYREEIVVANQCSILIYYNLDPLGDEFDPNAPSPTLDPEYRRIRMQRVGEPYIFQQPEQPILGDLDGDGFVNGVDLAMLLGVWGSITAGREDIDRNGIVDGADLAILLGNWS